MQVIYRNAEICICAMSNLQMKRNFQQTYIQLIIIYNNEIKVAGKINMNCLE